MRGRKVGIYNWCNKGNVLEIFSCKYGEKKNIRYNRETLIHNTLFYIFKLIFIKKINRENSRILGILGILR